MAMLLPSTISKHAMMPFQIKHQQPAPGFYLAFIVEAITRFIAVK
jgi:hypothetical protein